MANSYTSIQLIADRLLRHPLMSGISFEAIIDYTVDFLRIVQCGGFFEERCEIIPIKDYRGSLPEGFFEVNQIRLNKTTHAVPVLFEKTITPSDGVNEPVGTGNYSTINEEGKPEFVECSHINKGSFTYSTDSFHMSNSKPNIGLTYKIQGDIIYTSIKEGEIEMSYKAILLDEDGYPMIPDNSKFLRALEAYIKKQWFTILFDMGKLQGAILQNTQQEYAWAVGACESEFQKMSLDKAEAFFNSWRTLIPRTREHSAGFVNNGSKQNLKIN